jgi:uncharacterized protein
MTAAQPQSVQDPAGVAAFLRANPSWLAENPELYRLLAPPVRVHGDALADHMAAMLREARAHAAAMTERAEDVLSAGRAAAGLACRVQDAVVALIRATDKLDCIASELPGILAVDAVSFCVEAEESGAGLRPMPPGTVAALLAGRDVQFRDAPEDAVLLHAEAAKLARHDALVRVPGEGPAAMLALSARDRVALDPAQGGGSLAFLGRAVAASLGR